MPRVYVGGEGQTGGARLEAHLSAQPCHPSPDTPRVPSASCQNPEKRSPLQTPHSVSRGTLPFPPPASEVCVLSPGTSSGAVILGSRHPSPVSESCHHHLQGAPCYLSPPWPPPTAPRPPLPPTTLPHHPLSTERAQEAQSSPLWSPREPLLRPSPGALGIKAAPAPAKRAPPARPRATHGAHPCGRTRHGPQPRSVGTHALRFLFSHRRGV